MAGEVKSFEERLRRIGKIREYVDEISHQYRQAKAAQAAYLKNQETLLNMDTRISAFFDAITDIKVTLDADITDLLGDVEHTTVPHIWKPGSQAGFHHWAITAAVGTTNATIQAQDINNALVGVGLSSVLAAGDVIQLSRAEDAGNNQIVEISDIVAPSSDKLSIKRQGTTGAVQSHSDIAQLIDTTGTNLITNASDERMVMTWVFNDA